MPAINRSALYNSRITLFPHKKKKVPYKMPTIPEFLKMKNLYDYKKEPVWVYLEREMRENIDKKPYNEKVGIWLKFLRDLRLHRFCQQLKIRNRINMECGPPWFCELSSYQKDILDKLHSIIVADIFDERPRKARKALNDLGVTLRIPSILYMSAMKNSGTDAGLFMWNLYQEIYKEKPSVLKKSYDINSKLIMSSIVFIDLKECIERLNGLLVTKEKIPDPPTPKPPTPEPDTRPFAVYLQPQRYAYRPPEHRKPKEPPLPPGNYTYKFKLHSVLIEKRKERHVVVLQSGRICNYKFFEPPVSLKPGTKEGKLAFKLRMVGTKAQLKVKAPSENLQFGVGSVGYPGDIPTHTIEGIRVLPTEYVHMRGDYTLKQGQLMPEYIPWIHGFCKAPVLKETPKTCDCLKKMEEKAMQVLKETKCHCGHLYDEFFPDKYRKRPIRPCKIGLMKKTVDRCMYSPTRHAPLQFDEALIFQFDEKEKLIRKMMADQEKPSSAFISTTRSTISFQKMTPNQILEVLLGDLARSPLIIPHLPMANHLNSLLAWVRRKFKGKLTKEQHKKLLIHSERRWIQIGNMDFRAKAYRIPFTATHLKNITWKHRYKLQTLFNILLRDFTARNRLMQLEHTRMLWSTMMYDEYPAKYFLDAFYTLLPQRTKDTHVYNPYVRKHNFELIDSVTCGVHNLCLLGNKFLF